MAYHVLTIKLDWKEITEAEAREGPSMQTYIGAKTAAEHAVWKFADEHKHVDIITGQSL